MKVVIRTRRQWLQAATLWPACVALRAARKDFWETKDPAAWSTEEKQILLGQSPWAREGVVRVELVNPHEQSVGYGNNGRPATDLPPVRPGATPGGERSVPIGEKLPPAPDPDPNHGVQFRALARWETAKPVRLAGGPDMPELTGDSYVIRLRGLPLMPAPKAEPANNPNQPLLEAIKAASRLLRKDKPPIPCARLFVGSGDRSTELLLFFARGADPITLADKTVTLESGFGQFHLAIKFPLSDMVYKGQLAL